MPLPATITLNVSTGTKVFTLVDNLQGKAFYQHRVSGRPDLAYQLMITNPKNGSGRRGKMELTMPVVRTNAITGVERVDLERIKVDISISDMMTDVDRADAVALLESAAALDALTDYFKNSVGVS
jgi:hypothetical protein